MHTQDAFQGDQCQCGGFGPVTKFFGFGENKNKTLEHFVPDPGGRTLALFGDRGQR
jgi:hypothetical protein